VTILAWLAAFLSFALFALYGLIDVLRMWIELDDEELW